jgi:hypothetical protein
MEEVWMQYIRKDTNLYVRGLIDAKQISASDKKTK